MSHFDFNCHDELGNRIQIRVTANNPKQALILAKKKAKEKGYTLIY
jgi:hypothetical protein